MENSMLSLLLATTFALAPEPSAERLAKARADLKAADVTVRKKAIESLIHSDLSEHLFPEMAATLQDANGEVRSAAATAVGNLGAIAEPALPALVKQLQKDDTKEARETAARALGRIGKAAPKIRTQVKPLQAAAAEDADAVTRTVSLGALAMMEEDVPGQVKALRKFLHHGEALVRMKAAHALGMIGLAAKEAAPEIVVVLEKEADGHRRGYIARSLGNTGDPASLTALKKALANETYDGAKGEIRGAIQKLGDKP